MVFSDLLNELSMWHPLFSHLDLPLIESLFLMGKI